MSKNKDWIGNSRSALATLGARNYAQNEREKNDYYATDPKALELLLDIETFNHCAWECACGEGHLSEVLKHRGYNVKSTDLIYRGYGEGDIDFLQHTEMYNGDIITNPPYKYAQQFVEHALEIIPNGNRVAMFLKIQFLESKARRALFEKSPPEVIYVSTSRLQCVKNGNFEKYSKGVSTAIAYAWFIWRKGFKGETKVRWFN